MKKKECHERLAELLSITGTTQADMVEKTGINKSVISQYVNGRRLPRQDKLAIISEAYNVDPAWLMGFDVQNKNQLFGIRFGTFITPPGSAGRRSRSWSLRTPRPFS